MAARRQEVASAPISIARARALLGADGEGMTDAEVLEASRQAEEARVWHGLDQRLKISRALRLGEPVDERHDCFAPGFVPSMNVPIELAIGSASASA